MAHRRSTLLGNEIGPAVRYRAGRSRHRLSANDADGANPGLRSARATTPIQGIIDAEANYVAACGQFLQSATTARKINAEAVAQEIENWKNSIRARDEMLDLYWDWGRRDHPNYLTRQGKLRDIMQQLVERQDQGLSRRPLGPVELDVV